MDCFVGTSQPSQFSCSVNGIQLTAALGDVTKQHGYDGLVRLFTTDNPFLGGKKHRYSVGFPKKKFSNCLYFSLIHSSCSDMCIVRDFTSLILVRLSRSNMHKCPQLSFLRFKYICLLIFILIFFKELKTINIIFRNGLLTRVFSFVDSSTDPVLKNVSTRSTKPNGNE